MQQPEAIFKRHLRQGYDRAFPNGWYQFNSAMLRRGIPDMSFMLPTGVILWVEAKMIPKWPTAIQTTVQRRMVRAGGRVFTFRCYADQHHFEVLEVRLVDGAFLTASQGNSAITDTCTPAFWNHLA